MSMWPLSVLTAYIFYGICVVLFLLVHEAKTDRTALFFIPPMIGVGVVDIALFLATIGIAP